MMGAHRQLEQALARWPDPGCGLLCSCRRARGSLNPQTTLLPAARRRSTSHGPAHKTAVGVSTLQAIQKPAVRRHNT